VSVDLVTACGHVHTEYTRRPCVFNIDDSHKRVATSALDRDDYEICDMCSRSTWASYASALPVRHTQFAAALTDVSPRA